MKTIDITMDELEYLEKRRVHFMILGYNEENNCARVGSCSSLMYNKILKGLRDYKVLEIIKWRILPVIALIGFSVSIVIAFLMWLGIVPFDGIIFW